jgi:hypothetical protein
MEHPDGGYFAIRYLPNGGHGWERERRNMALLDMYNAAGAEVFRGMRGLLKVRTPEPSAPATVKQD